MAWTRKTDREWAAEKAVKDLEALRKRVANAQATEKVAKENYDKKNEKMKSDKAKNLCSKKSTDLQDRAMQELQKAQFLTEQAEADLKCKEQAAAMA